MSSGVLHYSYNSKSNNFNIKLFLSLNIFYYKNTYKSSLLNSIWSVKFIKKNNFTIRVINNNHILVDIILFFTMLSNWDIIIHKKY